MAAIGYTCSASQIDCTPLDSQMRMCKHHTATGASPVFLIGSLSTGAGPVDNVDYTRRQVKNDQPGSRDFLRLLGQF